MNIDRIFSSFSSKITSSSSSEHVQTAAAAVGLASNESMCPSMSFETRMYSFAACFTMGWIISILSVIAISLGNITGFVLLYSIGNITCMAATMFLMGPWRQCQNMFAQGRIIATCIFLAAIVVTIVVGVQTKNIVPVIVCLIIQFFAGLWYTLSYIPGARSLVISCCRSSVGA